MLEAVPSVAGLTAATPLRILLQFHENCRILSDRGHFLLEVWHFICKYVDLTCGSITPFSLQLIFTELLGFCYYHLTLIYLVHDQGSVVQN